MKKLKLTSQNMNKSIVIILIVIILLSTISFFVLYYLSQDKTQNNIVKRGPGRPPKNISNSAPPSTPPDINNDDKQPTEPPISGINDDIEIVEKKCDCSIETHGAVGADITFRSAGKSQSYIDSMYRGMTVTLDDNIDWAAMNYAINIKQCKGLIFKQNYYINKPIFIPKYTKSIYIDGKGNTIFMQNDSAEAVFLRDGTPDNLHDADKMTNFTANVANLTIVCKNSSTDGIKLGAGNNCRYEQINIFNADVAIHLQFSLNTTITQVKTDNCNTGIKISNYEVPGVSGRKTKATTCSNNIDIIMINYYAGQALKKTKPLDAIYIDGSVINASIKKVITEGYGPMRSVVTIDASNNSYTIPKNIIMNEIYAECINGYTDGVINILRGNNTSVDISSVTNLSPSLLVRAISDGTCVINVRDIIWALPDKNGKYFFNKGCGWSYSNLPAMMLDLNKDAYSSVRQLFAGDIPYPISGLRNTSMVVGYNQLKIQ